MAASAGAPPAVVVSVKVCEPVTVGFATYHTVSVTIAYWSVCGVSFVHELLLLSLTTSVPEGL